MSPEPTSHRYQRVFLIFNPNAGLPAESPDQLMAIVNELQRLGYTPEVFLIHPECDLPGAVQAALRRRTRLFLVSGGDGTIESVAAELAGTRAVLGVVPTGTANNVALSLDIPPTIPEAVALLRNGRRVRVDMGVVECAGKTRHFLEVCTVGLLSALFPSADQIQRGNLTHLADFLSTLVSAPMARLSLDLDGQHQLETQGHVVLVTNMPNVGPNFPIAEANAYRDGLLDVLVFADLTKLEVLSSVVQMVGVGVEDPRIQRYRVRQVKIETQPAMPVMADGVIIGDGAVRIAIQPRLLSMLAGQSAGQNAPQPGEPTASEAERPLPATRPGPQTQ